MKILHPKFKIQSVDSVSKGFKPVDLLKDLKYYKLDDTDVETYEKQLIRIMMCENCTLTEALEIDFDMCMVDKECVFDLTDYLEEKLVDLNKVAFYMGVYTGIISDFKISRD
jgi:hypothetical protein